MAAIDIINPAPDAITSFSGDFAFLSNFYPHTITIDGEAYPTTEHAFQALKTDVPEERRRADRIVGGDDRRARYRHEYPGEGQRGGTFPKEGVCQDGDEDRLGAHEHHARRDAGVVEGGDPEPEMRPKSYPRRDPVGQGPPPRERLLARERDRQEERDAQGVAPERDGERGRVG